MSADGGTADDKARIDIREYEMRAHDSRPLYGMPGPGANRYRGGHPAAQPSVDLEACGEEADRDPEDRAPGTGKTVDHPEHYQAGGLECIDVIEALGWGEGFNLGNALKYLWRASEKGNREEDLRKAAWYIQREIERA